MKAKYLVPLIAGMSWASCAFASNRSYFCYYYDAAVDVYDHPIEIGPAQSKSVAIDHGKFKAIFDNTGLLGLDVREVNPADNNATIADFVLDQGYSAMSTTAGEFRLQCTGN